MSDLGTNFLDANTTGHAALKLYDIVTPVAEMPGGESFLVYVSYEDPASSEVISEFQNLPASLVESYTGSNNVSLAEMSPDGLDNYMVGAALDALQVLPDDVAVNMILMGRDEVIVPDPESPEREGWEMPENGMDIREIGQVLSGNLSADDAHEMLVRGDLPEAVAEMLNSAGSDVNTDVINRVHQHASLGRDLPGYASEIGQMVSDPAMIAKHGIPADQVESTLDTLAGEGPAAIALTADATLDVVLPEQ